ncbi:hypothetical protein TSAR_011099 [Trichomalopsis sarcophagae]|uniref:Uncharacterized protein n=1 Tax=Trichomalopsis sarcophagae TaxID=543379 RepID=A0A232EIY5_9HYME|nr:hypothetical protein TSAR_011099 [Trichomalopsis sarcophagae]
MEKKNKLTKWEDTKIDDNTGKIVKTNMFHIHYGVSVPYKSWKRAINATTSYKFLRELVVPHIWNLREFVQRAVQIDRTNSQEEREATSSIYLKEILYRTIELGVIICQERSKLFNRHDEEAEDSSHSPRESDDTDS